VDAHAWTVEAYVTVIDSTWQSGSTYFGVVLPLKWIATILMRNNKCGIRRAIEEGTVPIEEFRAAAIKGAAAWRQATR